jgi:hypothetical protein
MKRLILITLALFSFSLYADERVLVIPSHVWSDGELYPEYIRYYHSYDWEVYSAHVKCASYARWLHTSRFESPMYSSCIDPSELLEIRQ